MIASASGSVLATFLIFCRVGTCLMIAPGFSRSNIPVQVRLFMAINVTLMLAPLLEASVRPVVEAAAMAAIVRAIMSELVIGLLIGLTAAVFFFALETMVTMAASAIGLSGIPGTLEDGQQMPALVPFITLPAIVLFFMTGQHWELLRGLINSYRIWTPAVGISGETGLSELTDHLSQGFVLALRVASPFIVYGVIVNLALGLANKLTPSIPVYFISLPFVVFGGLMLVYLTSRELVLQFTIAFSSWLAG
ncbi:flagellar biosynthesis protein FliR [Bradyrhizobium neotropicale]|uniref:flagellar biosynthesis protein FliR n=1 Tax=Bradyrhizobium neotropicale TaxID=1497615 RepID=UPI001AD6ADC6|nr:flagellar biosynthesis protein FliR [Bradyrhizobium neotropicale]MBO4223995.1 flagellar biosynthesis protein FliR [Bradyrhizobium neotropicale]